MVSTPNFGGRFVSASDIESYTSNSVVMVMASVDGQVKGYILDNKRYAAHTEAVRWHTNSRLVVCNTVPRPGDHIT